MIYINTTPTGSGTSGTFYKFGKDGAWNSSFTFGGNAPSASSQAMTDNATTVASNGGVRGTGVAGDGYAGRVGISVSGGVISVTSFSKDTIYNTAGGNFAQSYLGQTPTNLGAGAVTGAGASPAAGATTLTLNRRGAISSFPTLYDERWNFDDVCNKNGVGWNGSTFTTGSVSTNTSAVDCTTKTTITGRPLATAGDLNGDGVTDYSAVLVSGGSIGTDWGGFTGAAYFEVWNVTILSQPVPLPAAFWLFGSGLLGLIGMARRKTA